MEEAVSIVNTALGASLRSLSQEMNRVAKRR
jgi:hypothetical protein